MVALADKTIPPEKLAATFHNIGQNLAAVLKAEPSETLTPDAQGNLPL